MFRQSQVMLLPFLLLLIVASSLQQGLSSTDTQASSNSASNGAQVTPINGTNPNAGQWSNSTSGSWTNGPSSGQWVNSSSGQWLNSSSGGVSSNSSSNQVSSNSSSQTSNTVPGGSSNSSSSQSSSSSGSSSSSSSNQPSGNSNQSSGSSSSSSSNQSAGSSSSSSSNQSSGGSSSSSSNQSSGSSSSSSSGQSSSSSSSSSSNQSSGSSSNQSSGSSSNQSSGSSSNQSSGGSSDQSSSSSSNQSSGSSSNQSSGSSSNQSSGSSSNQSSGGSSDQSSSSSSNQSSGSSSSSSSNQSSSSSSGSSSNQSSGSSSNQSSGSSSNQSSSSSSNQSSSSSSNQSSSSSSGSSSNQSSSGSSDQSSSSSSNQSSGSSSSSSSGSSSNQSSSNSSGSSSNQSSNGSSGQSSNSSSGQSSNSSSGQASNSSSGQSSNSSSGQSSNSSTGQSSNSSSGQSSNSSSGQSSNSSSSQSSNSSSSQSSNSSSSQSSNSSSSQSSNSSSSQSSNSSSGQSSNSSSGQSSNSSTGQSTNSSTGQSTNSSSSQSSNSSSGQSSNSSSGQSSNSSTGQSTNSSTGQSTNSSSSQSSNSSSSQSSNSSSSQSSNSSSNQSSNSSSGQWSNSSSEWNSTFWWYSYMYYREDSSWTLTDWTRYFSQVRNRTVQSRKWNFTEWYNFMNLSGEFKCNSKSFVQVESAIILIIQEALTMQVDERDDICVSFKATNKLAKSIVEECKELEEDWNSFSTMSVLHYIFRSRVSEYKTTQRIICSAYEVDSSESMGSSDIDGQVEHMCDRVKITDSLLAFLRLELNSDNGATGCSDASLVLETVQMAQQSCPWEVRSALSIITTQLRGYWVTMCTSPTCNIEYADIALSSALMVLGELDSNVTHTQNVKEGVCMPLKMVMATVTNHTIDCQSSSYSSISKKNELVKREYVKRCGEIPQGPVPCVVVQPDFSKVTASIGRSFFFNRTVLCQAVKMVNETNDATSQYCNENVSRSFVSTLVNNCTSAYDNTSMLMARQILLSRGCLNAQGINDYTIRKAETFISYIQRYVSDAGNRSVCANQRILENVVINATISILAGESDSMFCLYAQDDINRWFSSCGIDERYKNNITATFSLVCPQTLKQPGCNYSAVVDCFYASSMMMSNQSNPQILDQCVNQTVANCSGPIPAEAQDTLRSLVATGIYSPPSNSSAPCTCDPAAAVNCIMDVHHLAKQITPDWLGLCPLVPESETCARSYVQGCDDCKKSTVLEIVHKLNSQLEETCVAPPVTKCAALSAMKCVTDLANFQNSSSGYGNDTICIKITITRQCVYENTENCDDLTTLSVTRNLEQVISKWTNLNCQPPEDQLKTCSAVFEGRIYAILGVNTNSMYSAMLKNNSVIWNQFNEFCMEVDFSWACINASLSLQENRTGALIVRQTLEALYKSVIKVCNKTSNQQLQCYSCQGDGQTSCTNGRTIATCNDMEICETTTSVVQNGSKVISRGCSPRNECRAGCDKYGCTYCCSDNMCNSLDNGPIEGTCNLTAVASCVFSFSDSYIETQDFQCSSANVALACISKQSQQCDFSGVASVVVSLTRLDLSVGIYQCLLQEADQTCDLMSYAATSIYISSQTSISLYDKNGLCGIVAESRSRVSQAAVSCTKNQYLAIEQTQISLEASIGFLDCTDTFNFTINNVCRPFNALLCVESAMKVTDVKNNLTCQSFTDIIACMRAELIECTSATELTLVNIQVEVLKTFLPAQSNCTDVKLTNSQNLTMIGIASCLNNFFEELAALPIDGLFNATYDLQSCLFNATKTSTYSLTVTQEILIKIITQFIEYIIEFDLQNYLQLEVEVSETCRSNLSMTIREHSITLFSLPFMSLPQQGEVCSGLVDSLTILTSACDTTVVADVFKLLDFFHERLLIGYCPDIEPIPRCLISRAEECYEKFTTYFGFGMGDNLCLEASNFVECAVSYTATCKYEDLKIFHSQAAIATDFISVSCAHNSDLVATARCTLLNRMEAQPGCNPTALPECTKITKSNCSGIEATAACLTNTIGSCISNLPSNDLVGYLDEISECRYGDNSHSNDASILTQSCSSQSLTCNLTKSESCLTDLLNSINSSSINTEKARQCLEENYNCLGSLQLLINEHIDRFAILELWIQEITPTWSRYESHVIIELLTLSSLINNFLSQNSVVTLQLWDVCWHLFGIFEKIEQITVTYPDQVFSSTARSIESIKFTISDMCNNTRDVAQEITLPSDGIENPACPVVLINANVNILISRIITEFYTLRNFTGESVCSMYIRLNQTLEASADASLSLSRCSSGFSAKVRFVSKIALSLLGNTCQVSNSDVERCDVQRVEGCVNTLYSNFISLGVNQTVPGLCMNFEETKACIQKYSYRCDKSSLYYIDWIFSSVSISVEQKCASPASIAECDNGEETPETCDKSKAIKCSIDQFKSFVNPFLSKDTKCRRLAQNLECIHQFTEGCAGFLPMLVNQGAEEALERLSFLGCASDNADTSFGCHVGCWVNKAYMCFDVFNSQVTDRMWIGTQHASCQYINALRTCVTQNTVSCHANESTTVMQALDVILTKFPGNQDSCVDIVQCSKDFSDLVRQIANVKTDDQNSDHNDDNNGGEETDSKEEARNDDNETESGEDENNDDNILVPSLPSLNTLCVKVDESLKCLERGFQLLPEKKGKILMPFTREIYAAVEQRCSNTRVLECYYCKNEGSYKNCEVNTEICPYTDSACMFRQTLTNDGVKYSAGCTQVKTCGEDTSDVRNYYCSSGLCNNKANSLKTCELEPATCRWDLSLKCATDFFTHYLESDNVNCSQVTYNLGCIQKYAYGCSNSKNLIDIVNKIFINFASTICVVNAGPSDCQSLVISSMQTVLRSAYISEGNSVCLVLQETIDSVNTLIASGTCSEEGKVSLEMVLNFYSSIAGNYCSDDECPEMSLVDYFTEQKHLCSGHIFDGIINIYEAYGELAKNGSDRDCGTCADQALSARHYLKNCNISNFVNNQLNSLDNALTDQCQIPAQSSLPAVCSGMCQSSVVLQYTDQVITAIQIQNNLMCWYVSQVQEVYMSYTAGCSSVQQLDVINYVNLKLGRYIKQCQKSSYFVFELSFKNDIYYSAVWMSYQFQNKIQSAFQSNDKEEACQAVEEMKAYSWNIPDLLYDMITGSYKDILDYLEKEDVCGDLGNSKNRNRRDTPVCQLDKLSDLMSVLIVPPNIATAPINSRNKLCQYLVLELEETKTLVAECADGLSKFQLAIYNAVRSNAIEKRDLYCVPLHYEESTCNFELMTQCRAEFDQLSGYATVQLDSLCRTAKFALECTLRFSQNCTNSTANATATFIQETTKFVMKQILGNNCSYLTPYFYCGGPVAVAEPACDLSKAQKCRSGLAFDFTRVDDPAYCHALKDNVTCVQSAVYGCQADQVASIAWPKTAKNGMCNISDASLNNVCQSLPRCSTKSLSACFANVALTSCSSLQAAVTCMTIYLNNNKQCQTSLESSLVQIYYATFYSTLASSCGVVFNVSIPNPYGSACVDKLVNAVDVALSIRKNNTASEVLFYIYSTVAACLNQSSMEYNPVTIMLQETIYTLIKLSGSVQLTEYNTNIDIYYKDTDNCFFSRAKSCLAAQIVRTCSLKLLTLDEKNDLCDSWNSNLADNCIKDSLFGCSQGDRNRFLQISTYSSKAIDNLSVCEQPELCMLSEAHECVSQFTTIMANFDRNNDTEALCIGRVQSQECLDGFLFNCSADVAKPVRATFKTLYDKVESTCQAVVLPKPPICPNIQERDRVCMIGNAFLCLVNFNSRILMTSDTLIWRLQCLEMKEMMVCAATNTTSCDPENKDVKIILNALDQFNTAAGFQCPWLTPDGCEDEKPCPVMTSGCDLDLERRLINRESTVCEIKAQADQCVAVNTETCTKAQKAQANIVINKKMVSLGLPNDISCQAGSIDGCLYSFLSAASDIYSNNSKKEACTILASQYSCIVGIYNNANNSWYIDLAKVLIDNLNTVLSASQCADKPISTCTTPLPVRKFTNLITQLALNNAFSATSFCAKSQTILLEKQANDCNAAVYDAITQSEAYVENCANEIVSCDVAAANIKDCISKIGVFSSLSCGDKQKAALCVTQYLPQNCMYDPAMLGGKLCDDTVLLKVSGNQGENNFVSENGLKLQIGYKYLDGSKMFVLKVTSEPVDINSVPRCLEGSTVNKPIAQVYTSMNPVSLKNDSNQINITVGARQDFRIDGDQNVKVTIQIVPLETQTNSSSGEQTQIERTDKAITLSTLEVRVEDGDLSHSMCSSVNDPHVNTFDDAKFSVQLTGIFTLARHKTKPFAVLVQYKQCAPQGTCNCGVMIYAGASRVTLSICEANTDFVTYHPDSTVDTSAKQPLAVYVEKDLLTYHVLAIATGTIVTVVMLESSYLQVFIQPAAQDFSHMQGLCGNYDGDAYNDYMMSDGTQFKMTSNETEFGAITANAFYLSWKVSYQNTLDWRTIYPAGVVPSTANVSTYCLSWASGDIKTEQCSDRAHLETCGFLSGEDQTLNFVALSRQDVSTTSKRRKRRQALQEVEPTSISAMQSQVLQPNNWTIETATEYCLNNMMNQVLQACRVATESISSTQVSNLKIQVNINFDSPLQFCATDIMITGSTKYTQGSQQMAVTQCSKLLNQNPAYQNNSDASDLAISFFDMTCTPINCNGHGTCIRGVCNCNSKYAGTGCEFSIDNMPVPQMDSSLGGVYMCEIGPDSDCESIFLRGSNIISSNLLSCHIREVEITETGIRNLTTGKETILKAQLIATNQVRCDLGTKSYMKRSLEISISNDGKLAYEKYQTFIAYDPVCYDCTFDYCSKKSDVCIIGNRCVQAGDYSIYNDCQYCNLNNPNDWTVRLDVPGCKDMIPNNDDTDSDKQTLITALIAVACTVVILLFILIIVCVFMKRREANRRRRAARRNGSENQGYHTDMPFHGQPIPAYKSDLTTANNLLPPKYDQYA